LRAQVNMLYLGTTVLILFDLSYLSRFWTQFEAWLSMQFATPNGLKSAVGTKHARYHIVCIQNAAAQAELFTKALTDQWATKTPQQAFDFLSKPDVTVTNQSDKEGQLPKIKALDVTVRGAFQAVMEREGLAVALANLAANNAENQVLIAQAGAIVPLVTLVQSGTDGQKEHAARALRNLADNDENKVLIAQAGAIAPLVTLVQSGTAGQKEQAAGALRNLRNLATEGMECSFWFVNADSLRRAAKPRLPMMQTLRTQEPHRLVQKTIGFVEGIRGAYKNILVVSHRWETPTDPDPDGAQALAVQDYLKEHPEIDAVWFDFSSMPQGRNKTLSESAEFKEMLPNINLLYLTCSVLILMDRSYLNRFWTQFEAYLSMRAITSDGLTNAEDPKARVTIKTADEPR
jgi:hypothetical protein